MISYKATECYGNTHMTKFIWWTIKKENYFLSAINQSMILTDMDAEDFLALWWCSTAMMLVQYELYILCWSFIKWHVIIIINPYESMIPNIFINSEQHVKIRIMIDEFSFLLNISLISLIFFISLYNITNFFIHIYICIFLFSFSLDVLDNI